MSWKLICLCKDTAVLNKSQYYHLIIQSHDKIRTEQIAVVKRGTYIIKTHKYDVQYNMIQCRWKLRSDSNDKSGA